MTGFRKKKFSPRVGCSKNNERDLGPRVFFIDIVVVIVLLKRSSGRVHKYLKINKQRARIRCSHKNPMTVTSDFKTL